MASLTWKDKYIKLSMRWHWQWKWSEILYQAYLLKNWLNRTIWFFFQWLYSPLWPWPLLFSFMIILLAVGLLGRVINSSQGLYLTTGRHKHRINTYTHQISMPCMGFEPTIPQSERAKRVHALDLSATVTGRTIWYIHFNVQRGQKVS
jgi:hypothetical protein